MSVMDCKQAAPPSPPAPRDPTFQERMARIDMHLARAIEHHERARRLRAEAERLQAERRRPRGFFIGWL